MIKINKQDFIKILENYYGNSPPVRYTVAVDFDRTLCNSEYPLCGEEVAPICNFIRDISDLNCNLILYTCRYGEALKNAVSWCNERQIYFDYVNENPSDRIFLYGGCRKISCDFLIDDCAYNFNVKNFI